MGKGTDKNHQGHEIVTEAMQSVHESLLFFHFCFNTHLKFYLINC